MKTSTIFVSLRGGRDFLRPTRQSLSRRYGIPERSLEKQREAVCVLHARHHLVLLVSCSRIKQQAGANKSVCSCFLPPDGVPAQPPCSAAFQRSCVLHRAFSYGPSARSADRIPARTKKMPIPDAQREGCGSQDIQRNPSQGDRRLRFRPFCSVPDGSYCKREKNVL